MQCVRDRKKRELKPLCLGQDEILVADFTGLFALRHWGSVDPNSQVCCKKPGRREKQIVAEGNLCFH